VSEVGEMLKVDSQERPKEVKGKVAGEPISHGVWLNADWSGAEIYVHHHQRLYLREISNKSA
jgi:hypothetical protein